MSREEGGEPTMIADLDSPIVFWVITALMVLACVIYSFFVDQPK